MGIQSNETRDIYSIQKESEKYLKDYALNDFLYKYYMVKNCFDLNETKLKYNYMISKYFSDDSCSIVDYVNKKLSGELDEEYRRRKRLQKIQRIEFEWECNDMYDDASCCDWKAIEW